MILEKLLVALICCQVTLTLSKGIKLSETIEALEGKFAIPGHRPLSATALQEATLNLGDSIPVRNVFRKLDDGKGINIGILGGSISNGNRIDKKRTYWRELLRWFQNSWPKATHRVFSLATPAKDSSYFHYCVDKVFERRYPNSSIETVDLWIIEHAANDVALRDLPNGSLALKWAHLEAEIRHLRNMPSSPALLFIYFAHGHDGRFTNAQEIHQRVATHYNIPAISWLNYMRSSGGLQRKRVKKFLADARTHPTVLGHQIAAQLLVHVMQKCLERGLKADLTSEIPLMPGGFLDDHSPLCVNFEKTDTSWELKESVGFLQLDVSGKHTSTLRQVKGSGHVVVEFRTLHPATLIFLHVLHSWYCLPYRGKSIYTDEGTKVFCPGKGRARIDRGPWTFFNTFTDKKYTVPLGIKLGIVSSGVHILRVEAMPPVTHRIQISSLTGHKVRA